jgi:multidrug efflux pump subunit AcrA (membrane-fusion protein)
MPALSAIIDPSVGAANIVLQLVNPPVAGTPLLAGQPILVAVTLQNEALTTGLVPPIQLTITAPDGTQTGYTWAGPLIPTQFTFTPTQGGNYLVRLCELAHDRFTSSLIVGPVQGQRSDDSGF